MKTSQVNAILIDELSRKKTIVKYLILLFLLTFLVLLFIFLYFKNNKVYYVKYNENSNIDYKVYLKDNEFYNNSYLDSNNQYISNLIDYITATFDYNLNLIESTNYKYDYSVIAYVNVIDKNTKNSIFKYDDIIINNKTNYSNNVFIKENIIIDYNKYNDLIKKFVYVYNLDNIESYLNVIMNINVLGSCNNLNTKKESNLLLSIPLTTKTVSFDVSKSLNDSKSNNLIACKNSSSFNFIFIVLFIITFIIEVLFIIILIKYIIKTRSARSIYQKELKKILNNYKSYIQKINNTFDLKGYQVLQVDDFTDMLELRDTLNEPILMTENKEKTAVYFIIPSNSKLLYIYSIKISNIKRQMEENAVKQGIVENIIL